MNNELTCDRCEGDFKGDPYTGMLVCRCGDTEVSPVVYVDLPYNLKEGKDAKKWVIETSEMLHENI